MAKLFMPHPGETVQIPSFAALKATGVYLLLHEEEVVYVGQAVDMRRRVADHIGEGVKLFDAVVCVPCKQRNLNKTEQEYIRRLVPKYNNCHLANSLRRDGSVPDGVVKMISKTIRVPRSNHRKRVNAF